MEGVPKKLGGKHGVWSFQRPGFVPSGRNSMGGQRTRTTKRIGRLSCKLRQEAVFCIGVPRIAQLPSTQLTSQFRSSSHLSIGDDGIPQLPSAALRSAHFLAQRSAHSFPVATSGSPRFRQLPSAQLTFQLSSQLTPLSEIDRWIDK